MRNILIGSVLVCCLLAVTACDSRDPVAEDAEKVPRNDDLHALFEQVVSDRRSLSPQAMSAHRLGRSDEDEFLGRLDVPSIETSREAVAMAHRHLEALDAFDDVRLSRQDARSRDILRWQLSLRIDGAPFLWHDYPVNQLMSFHNQLPGYMTGQHPLRNDEDVDFYIQRLSRFPDVFEGVIEVTRHRAEQGIVPPRFALEKTRRDALAFVDGDPADNPLVTEIASRADRSGVLSAQRREGLEGELADAVEQYVVPAYRGFADELADLLEEHDPGNGGVWRLPDGDDYYRWLLRHHTTTDLGPDAIHELGLSEVERISAEMDEILCGEGYCEGSVGERMVALNAEPRFLFEDSVAGRDAILETYRAIVDEATASLQGWFHQGPAAPIGVRRVPEYREATAFGAYYMRPAVDGDRPGRFFVNLRSVDEHPRYAMRTLAYHESVPGHHLQITRMQAADGLPAFRRQLSLHAHAEGWALYAEALAAEMGLHEDPYSNLGRLRAELFRAVRLVVDTGMHHHRWSRERGIDYMRSITGMPMSDVVAEIERYLVIPGQACSFKIGMQRIQALRERSAEALGIRFDIRDFHRVILDNGPMPMSLLDETIEDWIERVARTGAIGTAL